MNLLNSKQVQRGVILNEWEPSEHQSTVEGLNAFAERQLQRRLAAQATAKEAQVKVRQIKNRR